MHHPHPRICVLFRFIVPVPLDAHVAETPLLQHADPKLPTFTIPTMVHVRVVRSLDMGSSVSPLPGWTPVPGECSWSDEPGRQDLPADPQIVVHSANLDQFSVSPLQAGGYWSVADDPEFSYRWCYCFDMSAHAQSPIPERATKRSISLAASLVDEVEERTGKTGFSAVIAEALEQWLAMAKLREVVVADRLEFGAVSDDALRRAEDEWSAGA